MQVTLAGIDATPLSADAPLAICLSTLLPEPMASCAPEQLVAALDAAAAAGFAGVSVWTLHVLLAEAAGLGRDELAALIVDRGLEVVGVEAVTAWGSPGVSAAAVTADVEATLDLAEVLGAPDLLAVTMEPSLPAGAAERLTAVADLAAARGRRVGLEFLPWSGVPDLRAALDLLEAVDRPNLGLTLDVWHWHRSGAGQAEAELVAGLDSGRLVQLQLDDAAAAALDDPLEETMTRRLPPGDGVADVATLVDAVRRSGAEPVLCCEVFDASLLADGPDVLARTVHDTSRAVLA